MKIKKYLPLSLASVAILALPITSYVSFMTFKPALPEDYQVRGAHTTAYPSLPCPQDAEIISESTTMNSQIATLKTQRTPEEVQEFYATALETERWLVETKDIKDGVFVTEYKKGKDKVKITSGNSQNFTIATISACLEP